ncbi:MAG TPA: hypothetical protein VHD84_02885 [Candidatus Saccharimonadales bacterium]|nr:hypothetical protein [Candidatus Saccharimonadales bacterium]
MIYRRFDRTTVTNATAAGVVLKAAAPLLERKTPLKVAHSAEFGLTVLLLFGDDAVLLRERLEELLEGWMPRNAELEGLLADLKEQTITALTICQRPKQLVVVGGTRKYDTRARELFDYVDRIVYLHGEVEKLLVAVEEEQKALA